MQNEFINRLGMGRTVLATLTLYFLCLACFGGTLLAAGTSLSMHSGAGDYIGAGADYYYTPAKGRFTVQRNYNGGVSVAFSGPNHNWNLDFGAPAGAPLKVGSYGNATRFAFHAPTESGLDVYGDGRGSNTLTGSFEVKKIIYGASGKIISFWATFIQHSEGQAPALTGEVEYYADATGTPVNQAPGVYAEVVNSSVPMTPGATLVGIVGDDNLPTGTLTTTWALDSGPGSVQFSHIHALNTTVTFSAPGAYTLSLTAYDGALTANYEVTVNAYDPQVQTSLTMHSDSGDYIGAGADYFYTLADGVITAQKNYDGGVSISFGSSDNSHNWNLDFGAPDGKPFKVGKYGNATRYAFHAPTESGLEVSGDGRGSNTLTGSFNVKKIVFGPNDTVISFWATFIQHSEGSAPALKGEIKFNADITPGDFNGDGYRDIVMNNTVKGSKQIWFMDGTKYSSSVSLGATPDLNMVGMGDFDDDGKPDILLMNKTNRNLIVWLMNGTIHESTVKIGNVPAPWQVAGAADLNGDGKPDILLENTTTGDRQVWLMDGSVPSETVKIGKISTTHQILGSGDFNGDGNIDILIQDTTTGVITVWYMDGTTYVGSDRLATVPASLHVCGAGDFNGDGKPDIILQDTVTGERKIWLMDGKNHNSTVTIGTLPVEWQIVD